MEPSIRIFLATIVQSMAWSVLWLMLNTYFGVRLGLLFPEGKITVWHIVYYVAAIASFIWVFRHLSAKWKSLPRFDSDGEIMEEEN